MAALRSSSMRTLYFCPVVSSFYLSSIFFSSPIFSRRILDVYHTSTHGVGLSANLRCRSETCCMRLAENTGRKNSPSGHHRTTLSGYIFATKALIDNRKNNFLNIHISPTCPYNMVNVDPLAAGIWWRVWGSPANFNGFGVLAALLHGTLVVRRRTEGATYIRQGGHHVGQWPTF